MVDQVQKGLAVIRDAAVAALADRSVADAEVTCVSDGAARPNGILTISVGDVIEKQKFSYEELEDSGEAIDAPAAIKVRMMVSKFVR